MEQSFDLARAVRIFRGVEETLIAAARRTRSDAAVRQQLDRYRLGGLRHASDDEFYRTLVETVFYSGFKASTVTAKLPIIHNAFPDFRTVSKYSEHDIAAILEKSDMIRNRNKIRACVHNAQEFSSLVSEYGSIESWIRSQCADDSMETVLAFRKELQRRFKDLGPVTSFHFMTDCGLPVLKPDRVICRIFYRLGFIASEADIVDAVLVGRELAKGTGEPIRYIDFVFVAYGQVRMDELGLKKGICLSVDPACDICGVEGDCHHRSEQRKMF